MKILIYLKEKFRFFTFNSGNATIYSFREQKMKGRFYDKNRTGLY